RVQMRVIVDRLEEIAPIALRLRMQPGARQAGRAPGAKPLLDVTIGAERGEEHRQRPCVHPEFLRQRFGGHRLSGQRAEYTCLQCDVQYRKPELGKPRIPDGGIVGDWRQGAHDESSPSVCLGASLLQIPRGASGFSACVAPVWGADNLKQSESTKRML